MNWSLTLALALMNAAASEVATEQPAPLIEAAQQTFESFELLLTDGQLLEGRALERVDGQFHLELRSGRTLVLPADAVRELRLRRIGREDPPTHLRVQNEGELLPGSSGDGVLTSAEQQLAELPPPAEFQPSIIDPNWQPSSDWDNDQRQNEFAPSRWAESIVDPTWTPKPAYTLETDVTYFNPVQWAKSPIDTRWTPIDGFSKKKAFWAEEPAESYVVPDPPPPSNTRARDLSQSGGSAPRPAGVRPPERAAESESAANPEKGASRGNN